MVSGVGAIFFANRFHPDAIAVQFGCRAIEVDLKFTGGNSIRSRFGDEGRCELRQKGGCLRLGREGAGVTVHAQGDADGAMCRAKRGVIYVCGNHLGLAFVPRNFGFEDNEIREGGTVIGDGFNDGVIPSALPDVGVVWERG